MDSLQISDNHIIKSPFKFLKAYQKGEADLFFGRNQETSNLIGAFRKSSFVILYGPSGAGKSSLINCGLLNKLKVKSEAIFEIRRNQDNLLISIEHKLDTIHNKKPALNLSELIKNINEFNQKIQVNRKIINKYNSEIIDLEESFHQKKIKEKELESKIEEKLALRNKIKNQVDLQLKETQQKEKIFLNFFDQLIRQLKTTPYLIFDQFEEIFILGTDREIEEFGTFLSLLFANNVPVKILLALREEYFGRLHRFEKYLPHILYKNTFIDNPNRATIHEIIYQSFKAFNINQIDELTQKGIPEKEKNIRIELIIANLAEFEANTSKKAKFHLPFLQIYLDKLYREVYESTYLTKYNHRSDEILITYPRIDFKIDKIESFGRIDDVLKKYIEEVDEILKKQYPLIREITEPGKNLVLEFLKSFTTIESTKKRISIKRSGTEEEENIFDEKGNKVKKIYLNNASLNESLQINIWGEKKDEKYNSLISWYLNQLKIFRLLNFDEGHAELSHDILAKIINKLIGYNEVEVYKIYYLLKSRFDTYYQEYVEQEQKEANLLTENEISLFDNEKIIAYILNDEQNLVLSSLKKEFWEASLSLKESKKRRKKIVALKKKKVRLSVLNQKDNRITVNRNISAKNSPFKFLNAYESTDTNIFFGRETEIEQFASAFLQSPFLILYGPTGAGKSSLINCGLLIDPEKEIVLFLRRKADIIKTIEENIFLGETDFFPLLEKLRLVNEQLSNLDNKIEISQDSAHNINEKFDPAKIDKQAQEIELERLNEELASLKKEKSKAKSQLKLLNEKLSLLFHIALKKIKKKPYLVFDQFEEIFINGNKREIEIFGLFLSLIHYHQLSIKILLSIREEYFAKLSVFEKYVPEILNAKFALTNPDINVVREIINKSFVVFNINQISKINGETINEAEKKARRDLIIEQLSVEGEGFAEFTHSKEEFYLPFLQIYLDKLYRRDFKKIYGKEEYNLSSENTFPPLEFEPEEIKNFGDLYAVLMNYIRKVNAEIIKNSTLPLQRIQKRQNYAVKFLRNFTTVENTKEQIKVESDKETQEGVANYIRITDPGIKKKIQIELWSEKNDKKYEPEINLILQKLIDHRLIKINDGFTELSHDLLAEVINKFTVQTNLEELLRIRFNTYYQVYKKEGAADSNLINEADIAAFSNEKTLPFILYDKDSRVEKEKKIYWEQSLKAAHKKRNKKEGEQKAEIKKLRNRNLVIGILGGISLLALIISGINFDQLKNSNQEISKQTKLLVKEKNRQEVLSEVHKGAGNAFRELKTDRTKAYKEIERSTSIFDRSLREIFTGEVSTPSIIGDFKNDLYRNLSRYPFYSKELILEGAEKSPISTTKYLINPNNTDSIYLYFLTEKQQLFSAITDYTTSKENISYELLADSVSAFEPYFNQQEERILLFTKKDGVYTIKENEVKPSLIHAKSPEIFKNGKSLLYLGENQFVLHTKRRVYEFEFLDSTKIGWPKYIASFKNDIKEIQKNNLESTYLILTDFGDIYSPKMDNYHFRRDVLRNRVGAKAIKIIDQNKFFIGTNERIYISEFGRHSEESRENAYVRHNHEDGITSMDYLKIGRKALWLAGSEDRTVSVWDFKDRYEKKRLIGHSDKISFVSFINKKSDEYVLTASADGTIKIWNLRPLERQAVNIKEAGAIRKLKVNPKDSLLYAGFMFAKNGPQGYLKTICQDFNIFDCNNRIRQRITRSEAKGNITSFDFGQDSLIMLGGYWNSLIASNSRYPKNIRLLGNYNINDIRIKDNLLAVAISNGLSYYPDYFNQSKNRINTLTEIEFNSVDIHPTQKWILGAANDGNIYLWNTQEDTVEVLAGHLDKVMDATFSESGNFIVSGSWDNKVIIWKLDKNGKYQILGEPIQAHTNDVVDVEFFKDEMILTASSDHTVQLLKWDKEKGQFTRIPSFIRHDTKISAATFSLDGQYIFSGDIKGNIKKWAIHKFKEDIENRIVIQ